MPRVPRRWLRGWGDSRFGRALVRSVADAPTDPRVGALAGDDTRVLAECLGAAFTARGGDGVGEPRAAVEAVDRHGRVLLDLGAGGPGLPKRVVEALAPPARAPPRRGFVLLGLGMMVAGLVVALVAATRVVLPYDEAFVTVPRALYPFLAHDRMTLAGTMVSVGILYAAIGRYAGGARWARRAVGASAAIGFASFFLFLAYGYFDPLHAAISLGLLPFLLWGMAPAATGPENTGVPDLENDLAWRRAQWGTLGLVVLALGLVGGGLVIALIGSTRVFVASDLEFIGPLAVTPKLAALVAHDRAGFGGALVSNGTLLLLAAIWGIRRGSVWLWWAFALAGAVGFGAAIGVHLAVGYVDALHLAPVILALALHVASLAALRAYMLQPVRSG